MHFVLFENTSENRRHLPGGDGTDVRGNRTLAALSAGDVLWMVTRTEIDRGMPALCGRLTVHRVLEHRAGEQGFEPSRSDCSHRVQMDMEHSERCAPFGCPVLVSWNVWRRPFAGVSPLADEQRDMLEVAWSRQRREHR